MNVDDVLQQAGGRLNTVLGEIPVPPARTGMTAARRTGVRAVTIVAVLTILVVGSVVLANRGDDDRPWIGSIPLLVGADEVPLVEVEPDPSDEFFVWAAAYRAGDLPPVIVGQPTEAFTVDVAREDPGAAEHYWCVGTGATTGGWLYGCGPVDDPRHPRPNISFVHFESATARAWAWLGVPDQAVAVVFTDQDGAVSWQQPIDRVVVFPETVPDNRTGSCPGCLLEALDGTGSVIAAVDIAAMRYVEG